MDAARSNGAVGVPWWKRICQPRAVRSQTEERSVCRPAVPSSATLAER